MPQSLQEMLMNTIRTRRDSIWCIIMLVVPQCENIEGKILSRALYPPSPTCSPCPRTQLRSGSQCCFDFWLATKILPEGLQGQFHTQTSIFETLEHFHDDHLPGLRWRAPCSTLWTCPGFSSCNLLSQSSTCSGWPWSPPRTTSSSPPQNRLALKTGYNKTKKHFHHHKTGSHWINRWR